MAASLDHGSPLDIGSPVELVLFYGVLAVAVLAAAKFVSEAVVSVLDCAAARPLPRAGVSRYEPGASPRTDDVLGVAYLRGGVDQVARTLVVEALSRGWLLWTAERVVVAPLPPDAPAHEKALHRALDRAGRLDRDGADRVARTVAAELAASIRSDLEGAGLLRAGITRVIGALPLVAAVLALAAIGASRITGGFAEPLAAPIFAGEVLVFVVGGLALARVALVSDAGRAYLGWVETATEPLRMAVVAGRTARPLDVMLTAAFESDAPAIVAGAPLGERRGGGHGA